ncbi:mechanosensitive ion channel family protein [Myxococcota bacterium]|nr:mechanosensitive ion channel family protein [Myxococcota bacterium]MBU1536365.1 mechanosensitive ion channel family protein [Myxococcota bacterium]
MSNFIHNYLNIPKGLSTKIFITFLIFVMWQILSFAVRTAIKSNVKDNARRYIAVKSSTYLLRIVVFVVFFNIWIGMGGSLLAYFGLLSAGVAVALQEPIANFAGWIFIMLGKPFAVGDRIQIENHIGDIIDIRTSQTSILEVGNWVDADQSTGRVIHIPNGWFLKKSLANYTQRFNFIWNEIPVTITFESDWKKAKNILQDILTDHHYIAEEEAKKLIHEASADYLIYFKNLTPILWTSVAPHGITLTLRYLCKPKQRRFSTTQIWEAILNAFERENNIDLAYPTQRFYVRDSQKEPSLLDSTLPPRNPDM